MESRRLCYVCGNAYTKLRGAPRSTSYYQPAIHPEDARVIETIEMILMRWPYYGYRRMTQQLKREGWESSGYDDEQQT